jgi:LysM repeat protein
MGKTALDRLMASADRLDRIAPPPMHQVQAGETLTTIAESYGTNWQNLARINGLANPSAVAAGDMLRLPINDASTAMATNLTNPVPTGAEAAANMAQPANAALPFAQSAIGLPATAAIILPAAAQLQVNPPPPALRSEPDAGQKEDFSLWCKASVCPNLDPDPTQHCWPCTACGRTGREDTPALL